MEFLHGDMRFFLYLYSVLQYNLQVVILIQESGGIKNMFKSEYLNRVYADVERRDAGEPEFLQAVREVFESLELVVD